MKYLFKKKKERKDVSGYACYCLCGTSCDNGCEACSNSCYGFCALLVW